MRLINPPDCPPQNPSFSQAAVSGGIVYVAGQIGIGQGGQLAGPDVRAQTRQKFANAAYVLANAGSSLDRTVRVTVYMVDLGEWAEMNEVYVEEFAGHAPPKTTVQVSGLALEARLEIEFTAET